MRLNKPGEHGGGVGLVAMPTVYARLPRHVFHGTLLFFLPCAFEKNAVLISAMRAEFFAQRIIEV